MAAALFVTHGFLPPHPGPTAIAGIYGADMGKTLLYGIILAIPTVIISGPLFAMTLKKMDKPIPAGLYNPKVFTEAEMPGFGVSVFTALIPVILMAVQAIAKMTLPSGSAILGYTGFFGDPVIATMLSVLVAIYTFGLQRGKEMKEVMATITESISAIAMIILIIGGGGAFKQVLVDSGVDKYIAAMMHGSGISPLVLAWGVASALRLALGSATVAAMTTAGIVAPIIATTGVSPELMVIATGAGSVIFSHVNDPGFWIFKEYFNLSIPETFKSWSILETLIAVCGLAGTLILSNHHQFRADPGGGNNWCHNTCRGHRGNRCRTQRQTQCRSDTPCQYQWRNTTTVHHGSDIFIDTAIDQHLLKCTTTADDQNNHRNRAD
jgi:Gnt-I system high-affinity gluconate transporter